MTGRQLTHQVAATTPTSTNRVLQRRPLVVNTPGDRFEQEADRVAAAVMSGQRQATPFSLSAVPIAHVQREDAPTEKTDEEKYKEAAGKLGEAFLQTPLGKEVVEKVKQDKLVKGATEAGKSFIGTLPGKIITGAAAAGAVATLAATHKELPAQIPEIPLDVLTPGLSVEITYKGPVDKPTEAMITFKFTEQAPKGSGDKRPALTESEKFRAETARIAADQAKFRAGLKYAPGSPEDLQQKAEEAAARSALAKHAPGPDLSAMVRQYPWLQAPQPKSGRQLEMPRPSFGYQPPALFDDKYKLVLPGEKKKEDEPTLQRKADDAAHVGTAPPVVHEVLDSPGQPLDVGARSFMESRFGHDFGQVRVHTDTKAADSARSLSALAYTVGRDIVFGAGGYAPHTEWGQRLLAHELAHVVQQSGGLPDSHPQLSIAAGVTPLEVQAEGVTRQVTNGQRVNMPHERTAPLIQRQPVAAADIRKDTPEQRKIEVQCYTPGLLTRILTRQKTAALAAYAEKLINVDYCQQTNCQPFLNPNSQNTDYFDNRGGAPLYVAFLKTHNPRLTDEDIEEIAVAAQLKDGLNRPDILAHHDERKDFYEIKPNSRSGRRAGIRKIDNLESFFAAFYLRYESGTAYTPTGEIFISKRTVEGYPVEIFLQVVRGQSGLLLYEYCVRGELSKISQKIGKKVRRLALIGLLLGALIPIENPIKQPIEEPVENPIPQPVPIPAGDSAETALHVTPRPFAGQLPEEFDFFYVRGLPDKPLIGRGYPLTISYKSQGATYQTEIEFQVQFIEGSTLDLVSVNTLPLNIAPEGHEPLVVFVRNPMKVTWKMPK